MHRVESSLHAHDHHQNLTEHITNPGDKIQRQYRKYADGMNTLAPCSLVTCYSLIIVAMKRSVHMMSDFSTGAVSNKCIDR